jgi:hypothetical protein
VLTLGVDPAADERTALAVVEWRAGPALIRWLGTGVGDGETVAAVSTRDLADLIESYDERRNLRP